MSEPGRKLLDSLLDRQGQEWLAGRRPSVRDLLAGSPFGDDADAELDLIYNEIVLREELGEETSPNEYVERHPHLQEALALHFEVHGAISDPVLAQTARLRDTLSDAEARPRLPRPGLPDYELQEMLGRGGMAVVYRAKHRRLRRAVALKMFEPSGDPNGREAQRFRSEAEAIARLRHPNVIQIFEIGDTNGFPFLALELAEGGTLAQRLQRLPFTPLAAARLIETLARAAHHAHEHGIVHRDLKPANVLFAGDDVPKLTDFGLAKIHHEEPDLVRDVTRTGEAMGTPRYMAPEQAAGRNELVGPATDVYALGTLLYECLTGRVPFLATSVIETLDQIRSSEPLSPRRLQPAVPRDLETICLYCLRKEPDRRYGTAAALAEDLRRFINREPIMARPTPAWERAWKACRRRPTHAALIAVAILLLVGGLTAAGVRSRIEQERIARTRAEVDGLVQDGREALDREEDEVAEARFREAWIKLQGEPALRDYQTGVAGWLDHSRRAANRQRWKQRVPPREFDEKRDEAMFLSLLLDGTLTERVRVAHEAIEAALELTIPDDPAWRRERDQLALLDAAVLQAQAGAAAGLKRLDEIEAPSSRIFHARRALYLDELGRKQEADAERRRAEQHPPDENAARLFAGMDRLRRQDFSWAAAEFEAVLNVEPEHFTARLFLAVCALHLDRPGEARVGLTACIAQRPRFAWAYLYRGRAAEKLGDPAAARRDYDRAAEFRSVIPNH